jgi:predicted dehydrogenase
LAEVAAVAASSEESARRAADSRAVADAHGDWHALVEDPTVDVVHNCTPTTSTRTSLAPCSRPAST